MSAVDPEKARYGGWTGTVSCRSNGEIVRIGATDALEDDGVQHREETRGEVEVCLNMAFKFVAVNMCSGSFSKNMVVNKENIDIN